VRGVTTTADEERVLELRQYTLVPGRRDALIGLFDEHFVESQDAVGGRVLGQFRDLDDPDRFVWVRAFADMDVRRRALEAFYGGPVWAAHRDAANATMVDSDDVLLLRPAATRAGFRTDGLVRPPVGSDDVPRSLVHVTVVDVPAGAEARLVAWWSSEVEPAARAQGGRPLACLVTEPAANTFPALPVRAGEHVLVGFTAYDDPSATPSTPDPPEGEVDQRLRLSPTARSLLR
jgi:hypothetical protein